MKAKMRVFLWISVLFLSQSVQAQTERKVLISIETNEWLVVDESSILGAVGDNYCIVTATAKGSVKEYYVHTRQGKKGPYKKEEVPICPQADSSCYEHPVLEQTDEDLSSLLEINDGGTFINFKGKKYGPYELLFQMRVNQAGTKFFAVVKEGDKSLFKCSDGRSVELQGMGDNIIISPDGNDAIVKTTGTMSLDDLQNMGNVDISTFDISQFNKYSYYSISGKKTGPFESASNESWYCKYSNTWLLKIDNTLYTDGVSWMTADDMYPYSLWFADRQHYAWINGEGMLAFANGEKYNYPLCITSEKKGATVWLRWVGIENGQVVYYKRAL